MDGFIIIDKASGMSSYDVIRSLKRLQRFKKIGYIGTLDRNATGILPVAINEGVKLIPFFENQKKVYRARLLLGITTDTFDIEGRVIKEVVLERFEGGMIKEVLKGFVGRITQQIPIYSSKKINRRPLYKLAREGIQIEPPLKEVEIYSIELLGYTHPYVDIEVECSKGTYIRTLANDFGERLGCGATLYSLKRIAHGDFKEDEAVGIEGITSKEVLIDHLIPLKGVLKGFKEVYVEDAIERFLRYGMPIPLIGNIKEWKDKEFVKIVNKREALIGIGMADLPSRTIKIKRLINN